MNYLKFENLNGRLEFRLYFCFILPSLSSLPLSFSAPLPPLFFTVAFDFSGAEFVIAAASDLSSVAFLFRYCLCFHRSFHLLCFVRPTIASFHVQSAGSCIVVICNVNAFAIVHLIIWTTWSSFLHNLLCIVLNLLSSHYRSQHFELQLKYVCGASHCKFFAHLFLHWS